MWVRTVSGWRFLEVTQTIQGLWITKSAKKI